MFVVLPFLNTTIMKRRELEIKAGRGGSLNKKHLPLTLTNMSIPFEELLKSEKDLLTESDLMRIFLVSRATLYRWRKKKILHYIKMGRNVYYLKHVICKILVAKSRY